MDWNSWIPGVALIIAGPVAFYLFRTLYKKERRKGDRL